MPTMDGTTDRQIQAKKLYIFCFLGPLRIWTIYFNCTNRLVANTGDILPQAIGPGLTSHIAVTTMAKYFSINRGKSIAIAALGYAVGRSFLPLLVVLAISVFSWRQTYGIATALLFLIFFPLVMWLLSKSSKDGLQNADENTTTSKKSPKL